MCFQVLSLIPGRRVMQHDREEHPLCATCTLAHYNHVASKIAEDYSIALKHAHFVSISSRCPDCPCTAQRRPRTHRAPHPTLAPPPLRCPQSTSPLHSAKGSPGC